MKLQTLIIIAFIAFAPWLVNAYKFTQCDFVADYRCEAIHGVGIVVPPISFLTAWIGSDNVEVKQ